MTDWEYALIRHVSVGVKTSKALFEKIEVQDWDAQPIPGKRTVGEVAVHLAVLLEADLMLAEGATAETMQAFYATPVLRDQLSERIDQAFQVYQEKVTAGFSTRPTYWGVTDSMNGWTIEAAVHLYHHRSQLFDYLNILGYELKISLFE
ncbi:DinB family protein [uncultured Exiguobacterium sp.]|uniref:DinB family protein n=1 Tax=uncultured Exiguobacterium sp. TaxID=202669 RepID=UPI0025CBB16A|nr:DinB family protein [uncultured Exiguobacterium sp.]